MHGIEFRSRKVGQERGSEGWWVIGLVTLTVLANAIDSRVTSRHDVSSFIRDSWLGPVNIEATTRSRYYTTMRE
jgi:hypothetical protein